MRKLGEIVMSFLLKSCGFRGKVVQSGFKKRTKRLLNLSNFAQARRLLKMKEFQDEEFEIVGFYEGEGGDKGLIIWRCKTEDGKLFGCRPHGTHEERAELFKHGKEYVGKMLTVRFQELTADGIPRFPVGIAVRDYE